MGKLEINDLILYGDQLAAELVLSGERSGLDYDDVIMGAMIALQLLRATYPKPDRLFDLQQEAEGTLALMVSPAGEPC
jgi:hypothetical protein